MEIDLGEVVDGLNGQRGGRGLVVAEFEDGVVLGAVRADSFCNYQVLLRLLFVLLLVRGGDRGRHRGHVVRR